MSTKTIKREKEITITIDGKTIKAREGENLVKVARENDVFIPSLCYYEHIDPSLGTCRVCTCDIDGQVGPACMERVRDGMNVTVKTDNLGNSRKAIVEMMFALAILMAKLDLLAWNVCVTE